MFTPLLKWLANSFHSATDATIQWALREKRLSAPLLQRSLRYRRVKEILRKGDSHATLSYLEYLIAEKLVRREQLPLWLSQLETLPLKPLISIVVPVYNTRPRLLHACIKSVTEQLYTNWELCLVDDASTSYATKRVLHRYYGCNSRIRLLQRKINGGISRATNDGIAMAGGEFVALLDHDDMLGVDALFHVIKALNNSPDADLLFTDQDKISDWGRRSKPFFKPGWSPTYLRELMYIGHLLVIHTKLLRETGGCDPEFDGVQDFELTLRLSEKARQIIHVPRIAYHWRATRGSTARSFSAKRNIPQLQQRAVQRQLDRLALPGIVLPLGDRHHLHTIPDPDTPAGLVSVIICSKDAGELVSRCLDSLFAITQDAAFEVLVGDNGTTDPVALDAFSRHPIRRFVMPEPFHFAAFNNRLVREAKGEYLLFLNNDTEILQPDWITQMRLHASQPDVGAVGTLLSYPDNTVQHAGVVLGPRGTADHLFRNFPADSDFYHNIIGSAREVSAVTAACLLVTTSTFCKVGGFDTRFRHHYEDVDLCLRLSHAGYRNRYIGSVKLIHHESKTRGANYDYTDRMLLLDRWERLIRRGDPYSNPNFNADRSDFKMGIGGLLR